MRLISDSVRVLWQTICNILLEKEDRHTGEKENIGVYVSLQKFTDWVSNCFKTVLKSWRNNMCSERKAGIFRRDRVSGYALSLRFPLSCHLLRSSLTERLVAVCRAASAGGCFQVRCERAALTGSFRCCVLWTAVEGQRRRCGWLQLNILTSLTSPVCYNAFISLNNNFQLLPPEVLVLVIQHLTQWGARAVLGISTDNYFLIIKYSVFDS